MRRRRSADRRAPPARRPGGLGASSAPPRPRRASSGSSPSATMSTSRSAPGMAGGARTRAPRPRRRPVDSRRRLLGRRPRMRGLVGALASKAISARRRRRPLGGTSGSSARAQLGSSAARLGTGERPRRRAPAPAGSSAASAAAPARRRPPRVVRLGSGVSSGSRGRLVGHLGLDLHRGAASAPRAGARPRRRP